MSFQSPVSVLYNSTGIELALSASQSLSSSQPGLVIMGSGSNGTAQFFKLVGDGALLVSGSLSIGGTQTVSVSNSPTVNQGTAGTQDNGWFVRVTDGSQILGTGSSAPLWITGSVSTNLTSVTTQSIYAAGWNPSVTASVQELRAATSTVSSTIAADGLVGYSLLTANSNRKGGVFFLEGNRVAYVKMGTGADTNTYSVRMTNNAYWEIPFNYTGPVTVSFNSSSQTATLYVTDLT